MTKFKLGADPEMFLVNKNGVVISAIGIINGTKDNPHKISSRGHSVQVDNVLLEFNIPPSDNPDQMWKDIKYVKEWFDENLTDEMSYLITPSAKLEKSELMDPGANEFGCDPDFNCWTGKENKAPDADDTQWRSAGGHIHISYDNHDMDTSVKLVKALDLFLGVPSVIYDNDTERRKLYGRAGAFRFKFYSNDEGGVEYRVLSNFWISDYTYVNWVFKQVEKAFAFVKHNGEIADDELLAEQIVQCINNSDIMLAKGLIKEFKI